MNKVPRFWNSSTNQDKVNHVFPVENREANITISFPKKNLCGS